MVIEKEILKKYNGVTPEAMVESAKRHIDLLRSLDFHQIKVSIKASDVPRTVEAYRRLSFGERQQLRDVYRRFNRLSLDQQENLRDRFRRMPPQQRQELRDRTLRPPGRR